MDYKFHYRKIYRESYPWSLPPLQGVGKIFRWSFPYLWTSPNFWKVKHENGSIDSGAIREIKKPSLKDYLISSSYNLAKKEVRDLRGEINKKLQNLLIEHINIIWSLQRIRIFSLKSLFFLGDKYVDEFLYYFLLYF